MLLRAVMHAMFIGVAGGFLAVCDLPAADPPLSAEQARQALLEMMRSKAGQEVEWFRGDAAEKLERIELEPEKDGWHAWGAFRIQPVKGLYTFVVVPQAAPACTFEYAGSFRRKDGRWWARPPELVSAAQP